MTDVSGTRQGTAAMEKTVAWKISDELWRSAERYRGVLDVAEFGDVLLCLLYLRDRPAWKMLRREGRGTEWAIHAALAEDGDEPTILRPVLEAVHKVGEARQLGSLVEMVDRVPPAGDIELAQVFTALLDRITLAAGRRGGEFHTPESITELAAALLNPAPNARILDPCCKAGGFPAAIADRQVREGKALEGLTVAISDYSARSCALAYLNLRLRKLAPRVLPSAAESLPTGASDEQYDIVTANPPFNLKNWSRNSDLIGRWTYGPPPAHNSNFAWLQYVVASLHPGGRAAVVMPYSAGLSENSQERRIRKAMLDDGVLSAIIALPGQMFTHTDIPVTLWLLEHPTGDRREVLFLDAAELGTVQNRGRRTLTDADIDRIVDTYRAWREHGRKTVAGFAVGVPSEEISDGRYRLNPRAYVAPTGEAPDPRERARRVTELKQRLDRLAERAASIDESIDAHLKELSL